MSPSFYTEICVRLSMEDTLPYNTYDGLDRIFQEASIGTTYPYDKILEFLFDYMVRY